MKGGFVGADFAGVGVYGRGAGGYNLRIGRGMGIVPANIGWKPMAAQDGTQGSSWAGL